LNSVGRPKQTTPEAWAESALNEIERVGVGAFSVQEVARRLGVSKGGFYYHFTDRRQLLQAALALWEERFVRMLVERFDAIEDPKQRLHELLIHAGINYKPTILVQLMAASDDPDVSATLGRAATSRVALLRRIFSELGLDPLAAQHRAALAYSVYLGLAQLRRHDPAMLSDPAHMGAYLAEMETIFLTGVNGPSHESR
jgi:AcrR family transcriptional regulator